MSSTKSEKEQSFISDARRNQIINATIITLDELGYVNTSLAQIAKRANISTALISYHFKDKLDLMNYTLMTLLDNATSFVMERVHQQNTDLEKLHTFIIANVEYQDTHPERFNALIEIIFNARTPDNVPYYKLNDSEEEPLILELEQILHNGQTSGEFHDFNVQVMANTIQNTTREYIGNMKAHFTAVDYAQELVKLFDRAILRDE